MTTETEKLKKRLEFMNKELALHRRKLKRHTQNKEVKLTDKRVEFTQNSSDNNKPGITNELPSILETEVPETIVSMEGNDTFPAFISEIPLAPNSSVLEEENSLLKQQNHISNVDLLPTLGVEVSSPSSSTPKKLITHKNSSDLSPILMQTNCATKSSSKPQSRVLARRMKGLVSSARSKRKDFLKQIPLTLNHDMSCKVKNSLKLDALTLPSDTANLEKTENTMDTDNDSTLPVKEDNVYKVTQGLLENAFEIFPSNAIGFSKKEDPVLAAFFEDYFLILIQESQINFWSLDKTKDPHWLHVGLLPRQQIGGGISGCSRVNLGGEDMFVCVELWTSDESTALKSVIYSYNITKARLKSYCLELKRVHGCIKNVKCCVLPELSIVVSWTNDHNDISTTIMKFSLDIESQLILKSSELATVRELINSLHSLKGCRAVILGESNSQIFLWNHCTSTVVKIISCPRNDMELQWADEDQGFLFAAVSTLTHVDLITVNLRTGNWKQVRKYLLPETHKLIGVSVECGKLVAVFSEGFMCWDLKSGLLMPQAQNTEAVAGIKCIPTLHVETVHVDIHTHEYTVIL